MAVPHTFLEDLAVVLGVAAVTTVLCRKLHQPVVLGYLLAGLIIGPHIPIPLVADPGTVHMLSELGVILLMFSIGLEFSVRRLLRVGAMAGPTALIEMGLMGSFGFLAARGFGWTVTESVFTGAMVAISSTMVVAKAFAEQRLEGPVKDLVFGVLVFEDLGAIVLLAVLTAIASGSSVSPGAVAGTLGDLGLFLAGVALVGVFLVPRALRYVVALGQAETTLVASIGVCFVSALLAARAGYSVALGAFVGGTLVAESGEARHIDHLVRPLRDTFSAVFFVSIGMLIDPALIAEHWLPIVVLTAVVVAGKMLGVTLGAFLTTGVTRLSLRAGMSLAQIGEFSFIIAGVGAAHGATGPALLPVAVGVAALTAFTTPWLIGRSERFAHAVDRRLPKAVRTFAALYASWLERLRTRPRGATPGAAIRRLTTFLVLDAAMIAAVAVGMSLLSGPLTNLAVGRLGFAVWGSQTLQMLATLALMTPFAFGVLKRARRLGGVIASEVLPTHAPDQLDRAATPRRAVVLMVEVAVAAVVGVPLLAIALPFLPPLAASLFIGAGLAAFLLWRTVRDLQGHVRAGSELVIEAISSQLARQEPAALDAVEALLPGIGTMTPLHVEDGAPVAGCTLEESGLRALPGVTVLTTLRTDDGAVHVVAEGPLRAGDIVVVSGTVDATDAARRLVAAE